MKTMLRSSTSRYGPVAGRSEEQRQRGEEGQQRGQHVEPRRQPIARQQRQQRRRDRGISEYGRQRRSKRHHCRSPRKRSSAWMSTVSKRSRMRNRKMPMTMKAIRIEKATLISTTNGMPLAPVAASTRPFSSDMKPTTWLTALRRVTIISRPSSTTDEREGEVLARQRIGLGRDAQHHHHRQRHQPHAEQHGGADADDRLDLAVDAEPLDHPVQRHRDDDGLEHQRDGGCDIEMWRVLDVGLPGYRQRQHESVQGKDIEQRVEAILVEQHEAHQHQPAGQQMGDVEGEAVI